MLIFTRKLSNLALLLTTLLLLPVSFALAEHLPIKTYTIADGLARDNVSRIVRDSRGFLWFCTNEGLSRYDGYRFVNYGVDQGLPNRIVNDLIETRDGVYWVATNNGLCRFDPNASSPGQRFVMDYGSEKTIGHYANVVMEDRNGTVWCGGTDVFYRLDRTRGGWVLSNVTQGISKKYPGGFNIATIVEDRIGTLWMIVNNQLHSLRPNGEIEAFAAAAGVPAPLTVLLADQAGQIWVGATTGLYQLALDPKLNSPSVAHVYTVQDGLSNNYITSLFQAADGKLWVGALGNALNVSLPESGGKLRFRSYNKANGIPAVGRIGEDRDGNLWVGTESNGVMKIAANGFNSFDENDGVIGPRVASLIFTREGDLCSLSGRNNRLTVNRFDGSRFKTTEIGLPAGLTYWGWGWYQTVFQSRTGEWWIETGQGVARYPAGTRLEQLNASRPQAIYTKRNGLSDGEPFRIFEDSRGDVWISTFSNDGHTLTRWERSTETFHRFSMEDGLPRTSNPTAFAEDAAGNLWIGFYLGELARYSGGHLTVFRAADGMPGGITRGIFLDHARRLWVATGEGGVLRIDDPTTDRPHFISYNTSNGLSSNQAACFTEDQWGRIYIGTGRGVDRLDPESGQIKHYSTADGLANSFVSVALRDRDGALWFGTLQGLSRFIPQPDPPSAPPPIFINEISIGGVGQRLSALGVTEIPQMRLEPGQNQVRVNFFGLSYSPGEVLRYQYKLEGADKEWNAPSINRLVNYANLAPGTYRFLVRAVTSSGAFSQTPASFSFKVLPPVWRRWWFITIFTLIVGGIVYANLRARAARWRAVRESETRFRTLAETASDAIITIDARGIIAFVNPATEKVFGYTAEQMIGHDLTMLMPEYLRHLHSAGFARYQKTGHRHISWEALELPGLNSNGQEIPLEISFGEFTTNGKRYFTGIARDISERKRAAEALQRSREERLVELERVRRRIATDLHDDIGSSLTQISILSEVVRQRLGSHNGGNGDNGQASEPLEMIAGASRELVDSMSDIVWAINPQKDHLRDLTQRMRRFAADSFTARSIKFQLRLPENEDVQMGANLRREVFLIFKEGVNNMVKHSGCTEADIELTVAGGELRLRLTDNGRGFDLTRESDGHGLVSMLDRAKGIGGQFQIDSQPGAGTAISLSVELEESSLTGRFHDLAT